MNVFKRLFKIGEAEAHSGIDKLEDPIKMTEQGIRDLKKDLDMSIKALAEVKAVAIRTKSEVATLKNRAEEYENKAILLLKRAQNGELDSEEADRLATEALTRKDEPSLYIFFSLSPSEFLCPGAKAEINIDSSTMDLTRAAMKTASRFTYDKAAEHVYNLLLKKDCYPRFTRSEHFRALQMAAINPANTKKR